MTGTMNASDAFFSSFLVQTRDAAKALAKADVKRGAAFLKDIQDGGNWHIVADTYSAVKGKITGKNISESAKKQSGLIYVVPVALSAVGKVYDNWDAFVYFVEAYNLDKETRGHAGAALTSLRTAVAQFTANAGDGGKPIPKTAEQLAADMFKAAEKLKISEADMLRVCLAYVKAHKPTGGLVTHKNPIAPAKPKRAKRSTANGAGVSAAA